MTYDPRKRGPRRKHLFDDLRQYPAMGELGARTAAGDPGIGEAAGPTTSPHHRRNVWISFALASAVLFAMLVAADRQRTTYRAESRIAIDPAATRSAAGRDVDYDRYVEQQAQAMKRPSLLAAAMMRIPAPPGSDEAAKERSRAEMLALAETIEVKAVPQEHRVELQLAGPDAETAAQVVNAVGETYLQQGREQATVRLDPTVLEAERGLMAQLSVAQQRELDLLRAAVASSTPVAGAAGKDESGFEQARVQAMQAREAHDVVLDRLFAVMRRGGFDPEAEATAAEEVKATDAAAKGMQEEIDRRLSALTLEMASLGNADPVYRQDGQELARLEESSRRLAGQMREKGSTLLMNGLRSELAQTGAQEVATNGAVEGVVAASWNPVVQRRRMEDLSAELPRLQGWLGTMDDLLVEIGRKTQVPATMVAAAGEPTVTEPNYRGLLRYGAVPLATFAGFVLFVILSDVVSRPARAEGQQVADRDGVVIAVRNFWEDDPGAVGSRPGGEPGGGPGDAGLRFSEYEGVTREGELEIVPPGEKAPPLGDAVAADLSHTGFEGGRNVVPEPGLDVENHVEAGRMASGEWNAHLMRGAWGVPAEMPEAELPEAGRRFAWENPDPAPEQMTETVALPWRPGYAEGADDHAIVSFGKRSSVVSLTPWDEPLEKEADAPHVAELNLDELETSVPRRNDAAGDDEQPTGWFQRLFARQRSEAGTRVLSVVEPETGAAEQGARQEYVNRRPSSLRLTRVMSEDGEIPDEVAERLSRVVGGSEPVAAAEASQNIDVPEPVADVAASPEELRERSVPEAEASEVLVYGVTESRAAAFEPAVELGAEAGVASADEDLVAPVVPEEVAAAPVVEEEPVVAEPLAAELVVPEPVVAAPVVAVPVVAVPVVDAPVFVEEPVIAAVAEMPVRPPRPLSYFELTQAEAEASGASAEDVAEPVAAEAEVYVVGAGAPTAAVEGMPLVEVVAPVVDAVAYEPEVAAPVELESGWEAPPVVEQEAEIPQAAVAEAPVAEGSSTRPVVTRFRGRAARVARNGVRAFAGSLQRPESVEEMPEAPAGLVAEAEEMAAVEPVAMETVVVDAGPVVVGDAIEVTEPVEADEASVVASAVEESGRDAVAAEEVVEPAKDEEPAAAPFHRWTSVDTVYGQGQAPEAAAEATGVFVPLETAKAEAVRRSFAPSGRSVWDLPSGLAEERRKPARPMASASEHAKMGLQERRRWGLLDRFAEPGSSRPDDVAASGRPGEGRRND